LTESDKELLTVIIPCINEEESIALTVEDVLSYEGEIDVRLELLLIDDGSTDSTLDVMRALAEEHSNVRVQVNERNLGVGRSVMNAYEQIDDASWITVVPGDNEFHFASIHKFLAVREDHDLVIGYLQNSVIRPLHRRLASHAFATTVRFVYGLPYRNLNGMKLYRAWVYKGIDVLSGGHAYNAELLAKAVLRNPFLRITEVSFVARGRTQGTSKAFKPRSVARAVSEFARGRVSVNKYRSETLNIKP
jgi:glycosyltransferase involved in cell wall biosynthesis